MKRREIKVSNFIELNKYIYKETEKYSLLIDFHSNKDWIKSKNITITFIPREEDTLTFKTRDKDGYYIIDKKDNSIKYITNIRRRYEYITKEYMVDHSSYFESQYGDLSRDEAIGFSSERYDCLIDNGKNKKDYHNPIIHELTPSALDNEEYYFPNPYIIDKRKNGGIELYDKHTGKLEYICNIGGRYEYIFKGEYKGMSSTYSNTDYYAIIQLIPDKEDVWTRIHSMISTIDDPYIISNRPDGGVDVISKKDGTIKYICNIGKRFYYAP